MGLEPSPSPPEQPTPDIPVPSYLDLAQQTVAGQKKAGWWADLCAHLSTILFAAWSIFLSMGADAVEWILIQGVTILTKFQGIDTPQFFDFLAAMLTDLMGVQFSGTGMEQAWFKGGSIAAMQAAGGLVYDKLAQEFNPGNTVTPDSGVAGAKAFLGFMLGFSVREANVSTWVSLLPESLRFLDGIREYPIAMARNLGLGRLARRALQPLIQVLISDPLTWALNNQYRPKLLSEALAVRSWLRGVIDESAMKQILAWTGYSDTAISAIQQESYTRPPISDFYLLFKYAALSLNDALIGAQQTGTSGPLAQQMFELEAYREAESEVSAFLTLLKSQRLYRYIDAPTMDAALDTLPISPQHKQWFLNLVGQQIEWPTAHITLANAESAYVAGLIDLSQFADRVQALGYSDDDQDILVNLTLLKLDKAQYTAAFAYWTYLKNVQAALKAGLPPPPKPPGITG